MTDSIQQQVLHALYCLCRDTRHISAATLAAAIATPSVTPTRVASALVALERAGLVDASRARLTMLGLATAVRVGSAAGGSRRGSSPAVPRPVVQAPAVPLAAAPASRPQLEPAVSTWLAPERSAHAH
jgi:hypothetical protein